MQPTHPKAQLGDFSTQPNTSELWANLPASYRIPDTAPSLDEANRYCSDLAHSHYENFSVASFFLPKRLRQHFYNVYAYCRISDDLGDEVGNTQHALALLDIWESELSATYASLGAEPASVCCSPRHPVFIALRETIRECNIPKHEFSDLLTAFRQDQTVTRYETFDDLLGYCRYSANPVGHLVLHLCGYSDIDRQQLSDYTCTALQLANFWQDVRVDWDKGRVYLPQESLRRFNVSEDDIRERRFSPSFRAMMRFEVGRARHWFRRGLPLAKMVDRELAIDIELFSRGGMEILNAIEDRNFNVLASRPVISKKRKLWLVSRAALGKLFS